MKNVPAVLLRRAGHVAGAGLRERLVAVKQALEGQLETDRDQATTAIQDLRARVGQLETDRDLAAVVIQNLKQRVKVLEGFHGV